MNGLGLLGLGVLAGAACGEGRPAGGERTSAPAAYDLASAPAASVRLPAELHEISGLAVSADGRVFAHGDEEGTIYQLDPRSGRVTKQFALAAEGDTPDLGKKQRDGRVAGDFED